MMTKKSEKTETIRVTVGEDLVITIPTEMFSIDILIGGEDSVSSGPAVKIVTVVPENERLSETSLYKANKRLRSGERPLEGDTQEAPDLETIRVR